MDDQLNHIAELVPKVKEWAKTTAELAKLKSIDKGTDMAAATVLFVIIALFVGLILLFINVALAFWLGSLLNGIWRGFLILAAFYAICLSFFMFFRRKWILLPLKNKMISFLLKDIDDDEQE